MTKMRLYCLCLLNQKGDRIVWVLLTKVGHKVCFTDNFKDVIV